MIEQLFNQIEKHIPLTETDKSFCEPYFERFDLSKNSILEEEDKIPTHLYFILQGFMRLFYIADTGEEITTLIASPNQFVTSFLHFINQSKSSEKLTTITDATFYRIERSRLKALIDANENFKKFSLLIFEHAITASHTRANDLATRNAEMRYKKLMEEQPEIIQNVPIQFIASYLGIKPQSLSRIRKQFIK